MRRQHFESLMAVGLLLLGAAPIVAASDNATMLMVPVDQGWTDTGIDVFAGTPLRIAITGSASVIGLRPWDWITGVSMGRRVGPQGTYVWPRRYVAHRQPDGRAFPLPAMADGPFPAFCVIGRIGPDGPPFYVGAHYEGAALRSGRLWLGINDDRFGDNHGRFHASISLAAHPLPRIAPPLRMSVGRSTGRPIPKARVLLLYIDGLRPDVLQQMAAQGFLPNFSRVFLEQGLELPNAFSVFPSNTLIANGSLFTGRFCDRTGIKSQNQFERTTLKMRGQLSTLLPDGFIPQPTTRVLNLLDKYAPESTHAFLVKRGVPTLTTYLGSAYRFTTLPIAPLNPPPQWFHRAINTLGPFGVSARLPQRLDDVNAAYAVEELIGDPAARVIAVWLPMVDKTSHHSPHGQFGAARRDLALADRALGRIMARLREVGWERSIYLVLISDHGHLGGDTTVNRTCHLARDWAFRQLGCNAKVVGQEWMHPGIDATRFVFFDNQGAGQAAVFLPFGSYFRGPWRRNRLYELTHYDLRPGQRAVNLLDALTAFRPPEMASDDASRPVDLVLVKLDERRVLIARDPEHQALLSRATDPSDGEVYRYEPVRQLTQSKDGILHDEPAQPGSDPLGYLEDSAFLSATGGATWLDAAHPAQEWLAASAQSRYPDAVVTIAKFFAWQPPVADLADARDPDLVVTASEGWSFRSDDEVGTDHGYPLRESMRITCFLAGPNIAHGALVEPHRIIDILPTILEMVGAPYDPLEIDGQPIRGIYE